MAKRHARARTSTRAATAAAAVAANNEPGDPTKQPTATQQAEGVTVSAADPRKVNRAEFDTLQKMVHQLAIKVGI